MLFPARFIKVIKQARKSKRYIILTAWVEENEDDGRGPKLNWGYYSTNFPLQLADPAFKKLKEMFWKDQVKAGKVTLEKKPIEKREQSV